MPNVRKVALILVSDLHLSENPPIARLDEGDWYNLMEDRLADLCLLQEEHQCPVICAGDVFDHWKPSPRLINFAIENLPHMYAVPGQHDLPAHDYTSMHRTGYGVLIRAGKIKNLAGIPTLLNRYWIWGSGWEQPIPQVTPASSDTFNLLVAHRYICTAATGYMGSAASARVTAYFGELQGYNYAHFGDNHIPFEADCGTCKVINTGGFIRRTIADRAWTPRAVLLYDDGSFSVYSLPTADYDKLSDAHNTAGLTTGTHLDLSGFVAQLEALGATGLSFRDAITRYVEKEECSDLVKRNLLASLD